MSVNKIEQVKNDKGFKILDLAIYGIIILLVIAAFLVFHFMSDRSSLDGVRVLYNSNVIYEYEFDVGEIRRGEEVEILENGDIVVVKLNLSHGYNILRIDTLEKSADITEADCNSLSCVHMPEIKDNSGTIICQTHYLVVTPLTHTDDGNIIM